MYMNSQCSSVHNKEVDDFLVQLVRDQEVSTAAYAKPRSGEVSLRSTRRAL
jgi:hypothetical protein